MAKKGGLLLALFLILSLSFASAQISISEPENIYNFGDFLNIEAKIQQSSSFQSFFKFIIKCPNAETEILKQPLSVESGKNYTMKTEILLLREMIGNLSGQCKVIGKLRDEAVETKEFKLTKDIDIILKENNNDFDPGKEITVQGEAIKANGKNVDGFLEIFLDRINLSLTKNVTGSDFYLNFSVPSILRAGGYSLKLIVYEKMYGEVINEGVKNTVINIKQIPTKITLEEDKKEVKPGSSLGFKALLTDQADEKINDILKIRIGDSSGKIVLETSADNEELVFFNAERNLLPGEYTIKASYQNLEESGSFYVLENKELAFEVMNETLLIKNVGNVPYTGSLKLKIGETEKVIGVDLKTGDVKKYRLKAPKGTYDLVIQTEEKDYSIEGVALTGGAIGISELFSGRLGGSYFFVWIFLILVLGFFVFIVGRRVIKRKSYAYPVGEKSREVSVKKFSELMPYVGLEDIREAEQTLVIKGNKEPASIIAVRINNLKKLGDMSRKTISNVLELAYEKKACVEKKEQGMLVLLTPSITRTFKNEVEAVKLALFMADEFNEHNKKFKEKIDYGIGLNYGDIIAGKEKKKLKFTTMGKSVIEAKRVSDVAKNEVLLSNDMRVKTMNVIKSEKTAGDSYKVVELTDREQHKKFISGFLQRLGEDDKKELLGMGKK